jgi:gliding motility-associated-like protein
VPDKPTIDISRDTIICINDQLQLIGTGNGSWSWIPNINISDPAIPNPVVSPNITTTYIATLTRGTGCTNTDSVKVEVKPFVQLLPISDTTICLGDTIQINPVSDGLKFNWEPAAYVISPSEKNGRLIAPSGTTTFQLTATFGGCSSTTTFKVSTVPYPIVNAGNDTSICNKDTVFLNGSGNANTWTWTPDNNVRNPDQAFTYANPAGTTTYILKGISNNGCPKPAFDTVIVNVIPEVRANAGTDTVVVAGQPLQLNATGASNYQWFPSNYLNNPNIANPVAIFDQRQESFRYVVVVSTPQGCKDVDTINIKIFKTQPGFFVPSAFTPDNNGLNDIFRPVAVGIRQFDYFKIFNRWGNEIFSTSISGKGWDGNYKGQMQESGQYVWIVQGIDFTGKKHFLKGTLTLIR